MMEMDEDVVHLTDYNRSVRNTSKNTHVLETIDVSDYPTSSQRSCNVYNKELCKDNKPLTDFINKCILLDQKDGMEKVITKVMLPAYVKAETEYKQSEKFRRVVTKAFQRLTDYPEKKYTHISDIVDTLKLHAAKPKMILCNLQPASVNPVEKKRVTLVTLSTKVSGEYFGEPNRKRPMVESSKVSPKKSKPEVIALDDDDDDIISIDDDNNKVLANNNYEQINPHSANENDNLVNGDTIEIPDSQELKIIETNSDETDEQDAETNKSISKFDDNKSISIEEGKEQENESAINDNVHEKENLGSNEDLNDGNKLLVPHKEKIVKLEKPRKKEPAERTEEEKANRIKVIEAKIDQYHNTIAKLDLEEVTEDTANSPYYKRHRYQAMIVKLHKELCTLVGEQPPEQRKIRFQIKEDVPKGPIKRLEKFLNKHTDADGVAPFPDFSDVIRCVQRANEKDGLGWSKTKVMEEAQALFTYCGRALQKKRQSRDWKHLRSLVRAEEFEADPAETDPELQARLEANRRVAKQREAEVLSKFTQMQTASSEEATATTSQNEERLQIEMDPTGSEDSSSDEEPEKTNITPVETVPKETNNTEHLEIDASIVKQEPVEPIQIQYKGDISLVIKISDSESDDEL